MKKLLLSLLLCATVSAFSQEKGTAKDSIPYAKWSCEFDAGLGLAEMVSSDFQMRGDLLRLQMRVLYSPEKNFRFEMGFGVFGTKVTTSLVTTLSSILVIFIRFKIA